MPQVARISDSISHGGSIITGSPDTFNENLNVARVSDKAACAIHGIVEITSGSSKTFVNNLPIARIGDSLSCGAVITSGSTSWADEG